MNNLVWKEVEHGDQHLGNPTVYHAITHVGHRFYTYILHSYPLTAGFYPGKTNAFYQTSDGGVSTLKDLGKFESLDDAKKECEFHSNSFLTLAKEFFQNR